MKNYLEWLAQDTPTKWWHDSAIPAEIDAAIANGALGVTTNPVLTYKSLQAVPDFWQPEVERIPGDLAPALRAEELLRIDRQLRGVEVQGHLRPDGGPPRLRPRPARPLHLQRFRQDARAGPAIRLVGREHRRQGADREGRTAGHRGAGREGHRGLHHTELLRLAGAGGGRGLRAGCRTRQGGGHPGPPLLRGPAGRSPGRVSLGGGPGQRHRRPAGGHPERRATPCARSRTACSARRASPPRSCPRGCAGSTTSRPWPVGTWCSRSRRGSSGWPSRRTCRGSSGSTRRSRRRSSSGCAGSPSSCGRTTRAGWPRRTS